VEINKMLFCYISSPSLSPTQPLHPTKGGTKVPLPFHIMKMPRSTIYFLPSAYSPLNPTT